MKELLKKIAPVLENDAYAVGGFVRDLLLKKTPADLDLIVRSDPARVVRELAELLGGSYFFFKKEKVPLRGEIHSVVFDNFRIDVAAYGDLKEDLAARDFTINAIAAPLSPLAEGRLEPIDPFGGLKDLKKRQIRTISEKNLREDPLRSLRAIRLAAQLDFEVEPKTFEAVVKTAPLLKRTAPERVAAELRRALEGEGASRFLELLSQTPLWEEIFGLQLSVQILSKMKALTGKKGTALVLFPAYLAGAEKLKDLPLGSEAAALWRRLEKALRALPGLLKDREAAILFADRYGSLLEELEAVAPLYGLEEEFGKFKRFFKTDYQRAKRALLGGSEVAKILGVKPSPLVGEALLALRVAQSEGRVKTEEEAKKFLLERFKRS